ncbi:hypothetical protein BpHYR1_034751 [Brachionus plicatilis]|uniref:Uncharacterized protein n=1 Tax=Brachionus plicatilis TaxID=10195 RepID=A0A3M7RSG3_BRAPC|nr:hypothetical protein BpHYR1_034751 [Brachionus plicatilis]
MKNIIRSIYEKAAKPSTSLDELSNNLDSIKINCQKNKILQKISWIKRIIETGEDWSHDDDVIKQT